MVAKPVYSNPFTFILTISNFLLVASASFPESRQCLTACRCLIQARVWALGALRW